MKNFKISHLFAAVAFVAVLACTGCAQEEEAASFAIEGTWVSTTGEKFVIEGSDYDNYSHWYVDNNGQWQEDDTKWYLSFSTNNIEIDEIDETSGYVYGQFDDKKHLGYGAELGDWYAFYYFDLKEDRVKISQAAGPKFACKTLEEAKKTFTVKNGYMGKDKDQYSSCKRVN